MKLLLNLMENNIFTFQKIKNKKSTFFTQEEIDNIQYRDMIKIKYCEQNDYDLIRIPYMNYDILDENYFMNKLIIHKERGTWTR